MKMHFTKMLGVCCGLLALLAFSTSPISAQCVVDGGELISTAPDNRFCLGSESPLIVQPELVGNVGDNSLWVLTPQENKTVLASSTTGADWDLNDFADGNYRVWHVSYADGEDLADVLAAPWNSGPGCWDNSNAYRVRLRSNEAVTIDSDSETSFCAGEAGDFDATSTPNMGANGVWALTDDSGEAVEIKWNTPNFDLDALAPGTYTVYFVNWSPNFNPIPTVTNLADLEACVGVSNGIELTVLDCTLDCPELGGNIGDACDLDGEEGIINEDCECEEEGCVEVPVLDEECLVDINSEAYATVIADDPFCCDVQWDGICQGAYAAIACAPEFDCPELEANIGDDCGENGTVSEDCECVEEELDCLNDTQFPSATITQTGQPGIQNVSTCVFWGEFTHFTNISSGETYEFGADNGTYITLRSGSSDGPVVAAGFSPLTYTADSDADLYAHYNEDENCGTASSCIATTIECTSCIEVFDCPELEANIGDDCGENGTVSEDCVCVETEPIANDNCATATPIACGGTATGSTADATFSDAGSCGTGHTSPEVWYVLTLENDAEVTANTFGSTFDTKLTVWSGSCEAPVCVGGNDDTGGLQSQVVFDGTAGTTYYLMVHGFSQNTGDYTLNVTCIDDEPGFDCPELGANIGDACGENGTVSEDCACVEPAEGDICLTALPISCGDLVTGSTEGASFSDAGACDGVSHTSSEVWYALTLTEDAAVEVNTAGSDFDTKLTVWTGSCEAPVCVAANDDAIGLQSAVFFDGTAGSTYIIMVHGFGSGSGAYSLEVVCETPPEFDCPELGANFGDACTTIEGAPGTVNEFCECEADEIVCTVVPEGDFFCQVDITSAAFAEVQATDPFCCNNTWDGICQGAYDELGGPANPDPSCAFDCPDLEANIGDACTTADGAAGTVNELCECEPDVIICTVVPEGDFFCQVDINSAAFAEVQATDPFCCNNTWDGICQNAYDALGGPANPDPACEVTFDCPELEANIGDECGVNGTINADCECVEASPVANDVCADATDIGCGESATGSTADATFTDAGFCGTGHSSPEVWYAFTPSTNGLASATTCNEGSDFDTKLTVFTGACDALECVGGNDDSSCSFSGLRSTVNFEATAGVTYYIMVHGFGQNTGNYELSVTCTAFDCPDLEANIGDSCDAAGEPGEVNEACECVAIVPSDGCTNGTSFGTRTISCDAPDQVITGSWANEYSTINGIETGLDYVFTSSNAEYYVTVANSDGTEILAFGQGEVTWTATFDGTVRFYTHVDNICSTTSGSATNHTRSVSVIGCAVDCPDLEANIGDECDAAGEPGEVNEACECVPLEAQDGCGPATISFGAANLTGDPGVLTITSCAFFTEYSTVTGAEAGSEYEFTATNSDNALYITVRSGTSDGPVVAFGPSPLAYTATSSDALYLHYSLDQFCNVGSGCIAATVECTSCGVAPACPDGEIEDCNGNCAPASWVGDGFCDDGSFTYNGVDIFFNCEEFDNDGGDCTDPAPTCESAPAECVDTDSEAFATVIADDPFCCDVSWDGSCQDAYDLLSSTCTGTTEPDCSPGTGCTADFLADLCCLVDVNSTAYATVVADDPFCCDTSWDSLCQESYDLEGGPSNPTCDGEVIPLGDQANGGATLSSYPNPTPSTSFVTFTIDEPQQVTVEVYDMSGRRIQTLFHQSATANQDYVLQFDGSGLPSGIYIYRLTTESEVIIDKFMIRK